MKARFGLIVCFSVILLFVGSAWAGGYDNRTNWSAEYMRTWNRNAATDSADGVLYNPAGMTKMDDGMYANLSVQYIDKYAVNTIDGEDFSSREPSYIPGVFALYKKNRWAAMFGFSNFGGGGSVNFKDGNWRTQQAGLGITANANAQLDAAEGLGLLPVPASWLYYSSILNQQLEAESHYLGYSVGGAYKINDMFSASLGVRYITADRKVKGSLTVSAEDSIAGTVAGVNDDVEADIDYKQDATGWGFILGLNISPNDKWNIGLRYETETQLDFKASVSKDTIGLLPSLGVVDGEEARRNLPATLALGVSWRTTPKIRLETNLTYYFAYSADWSGDGFENIHKNVKNGYDLGLACAYTINAKWEASLGVLYTELGAEPADMTPESPELEAFTIGGGVGFKPTAKWTINAGIGNVFYMNDSYTEYGRDVTFKKNNFALAVGAQYKFF